MSCSYIISVAGKYRLIAAEEYLKMGAPGLTRNTPIHIVLFATPPESQDEVNNHLERAFLYQYEHHPLDEDIRVLTIPAYVYFEDFSDNRAPTLDELKTLNYLPSSYLGLDDLDFDDIVNELIPQKHPYYAAVRCGDTVMLFEDYKKLGYPGIAWDTEVIMVNTKYKTPMGAFSDDEKEQFAYCYIKEKAVGEDFIMETAHAFNHFENIHPDWKCIDHHRHIEGIVPPSWIVRP